MILFRQLAGALGVVLSVCGACSADAAEILHLEHQYKLAGVLSAQFNRLADGVFYSLERVDAAAVPGQPTYRLWPDLNIRLTGIDALTGASVVPRIASLPGQFSSPFFITEGNLILQRQDQDSENRWYVYDKNSGNLVGSRRLIDDVHGAVVSNNVLTLVQNVRGGAYLSTFTLPGMHFVGESHPPALARTNNSIVFRNRIVAFGNNPPESNAGPVELITFSLDGQQMSRVRLANRNPDRCHFQRVVEIKWPHLIAELGCELYVIVDLEQPRLVRTFPEVPNAAGSWVTMSDNLVFIKPEPRDAVLRGNQPRDAGEPTGSDVLIFDLESGDPRGHAILAPGQIVAVGKRLLFRPYANPSLDILVYTIDETALSR